MSDAAAAPKPADLGGLVGSLIGAGAAIATAPALGILYAPLWYLGYVGGLAYVGNKLLGRK